MFQSLSRDSGHLNVDEVHQYKAKDSVSIPQSGFGAFELTSGRKTRYTPSLFQSLSRDSGHLNSVVGWVSHSPG